MRRRTRVAAHRPRAGDGRHLRIFPRPCVRRRLRRIRARRGILSSFEAPLARERFHDHHLRSPNMTNLQKQASRLAILALAASVSVGVGAQSTGASGSSDGGAAAGGATGGGVTSSSMSFQQWLNTQQGKRISRKAYMDEVSRRWDAMDRSNQGLTYDEITRTYGSANMGGPTANTPTQQSGVQK